MPYNEVIIMKKYIDKWLRCSIVVYTLVVAMVEFMNVEAWFEHKVLGIGGFYWYSSIRPDLVAALASGLIMLAMAEIMKKIWKVES